MLKIHSVKPYSGVWIDLFNISVQLFTTTQDKTLAYIIARESVLTGCCTICYLTLAYIEETLLLLTSIRSFQQFKTQYNTKTIVQLFEGYFEQI